MWFISTEMMSIEKETNYFCNSHFDTPNMPDVGVFVYSFLFSVVFCVCDPGLFLVLASAHSHSCLWVDQREKCRVRQVMTVQVSPRQVTDCLNVVRAATAVFVFGAVVAAVAVAVVAVVFAVELQSSVGVLCVVAVFEPAVAVSAVEMFVIGVLVVHAVAVAVAGPPALLTTFATGHYFVVD